MLHTRIYLDNAEIAAEAGDPVLALSHLRKLSLDDFGLFMISLPSGDYPKLSAILPRMADAKVQKTWTGSSGVDLLKQTLAFTRTLEGASVRYRGKPLHGTTLLDFGCGYGRILRMLYYYSNPNRIWGVDAWEKSLSKSREDGVLGNLALSERVPTSLPVGDTEFDVAFAFSVFTHLAPDAGVACLNAVRQHMTPGGIFVPTIRPVEFWAHLDKMRGTNRAQEKTAEHIAKGVAYLPHAGVEGETYGDTSLTLEFFDRPGWEVLGYDRSIFDSFQIGVVLIAV